MKIAKYDTDLTDDQWTYLQPMLSKPAKRGRPAKDRRRIIDAILYLVKCGCPWRYLPADFPNWKTVYHVFRQWVVNHQWAVIHDTLRVLVRRANGRRSRPTAAILDSQSVKSAGHGGSVGYDAGKRIKGRKRHLLVDTLGLILGVAVTPASTTERGLSWGLVGDRRDQSCWTESFGSSSVLLRVSVGLGRTRGVSAIPVVYRLLPDSLHQPGPVRQKFDGQRPIAITRKASVNLRGRSPGEGSLWIQRGLSA